MSDDLLRKHGIVVPGGIKPGQNRKTVCPKCSPSRKNKTDPCLSVLLEEGGRMLKAKCHHCGWKLCDDGRVPEERKIPRGISVRSPRNRSSQRAARQNFGERLRNAY